MKDRLVDIKPAGVSVPVATGPPEKKKEGKKGVVDVEDPIAAMMNSFYEEIATINDLVTTFKNDISKIEELHNKALNVISEEQSAATAKELDRLVDSTNKKAGEIRNRLKAMDGVNKKLSQEHPDSSNNRVRTSQHSASAKRFLDAMTEYKDIQQKFQAKYKQRMQKQFLIVKPGATPEELTKMLESDNKGQPVFSQLVQQSSQRDEAKRALQDIQDRHQDIFKIEQSIIELQQLFLDIAVLVNAQGEQFQQIEVHVGKAIDHTEVGVKELHEAGKLQKKSRKKMMVIIGCIIVIIVIIVVVVVVTKG